MRAPVVRPRTLVWGQPDVTGPDVIGVVGVVRWTSNTQKKKKKRKKIALDTCEDKNTGVQCVQHLH